jgi:catechol 2,3-dioxygenase-like lactoylglutathione lyase family enzyme
MLIDGLNHVGMLTKDTDRLVEFYASVFDATAHPVDAVPSDDVRMTIINIGNDRELNVFEIKGNHEAEKQTPMFGRGRLDHIALLATSMDAFEEIRRRLMARGAADDFVTDFGTVYSLFFRDPDGNECEVVVPNPDAVPGVTNPPGTPAARFQTV